MDKPKDSASASSVIGIGSPRSRYSFPIPRSRSRGSKVVSFVIDFDWSKRTKAPRRGLSVHKCLALRHYRFTADLAEGVFASHQFIQVQFANLGQRGFISNALHGLL